MKKYQLKLSLLFCFQILFSLSLCAQNDCISNCNINHFLNEEISNNSHLFQATNNVSSDAKISGNAIVDYTAGNCIELLPNFEVQTGAEFLAEIQPCSQSISSDNLLASLLAGLRSNIDSTMQAQSELDGWPAPVCGGYLFVSLDNQLNNLAGDHNNWTPTAMTTDAGFYWSVENITSGGGYKYTDQFNYQADPWSRSYLYDDFGELSLVLPNVDHLDRHFAVTDGNVLPRTVRIWVPQVDITHMMYMHDGQNLFNPNAIWGGWMIDQVVPSGMMIVGIDNTAARFDEYTHVTDLIGGNTYGGAGDDYADFVQLHVRQLIRTHYGEPSKIGVLGSSLGGLISLHIALRYPNEFDFAGSMSGTLGWGSIGLSNGQQNETIIERYANAGQQPFTVYIDSGGNGTCFDNDGDGIEDDDPNANDNYCENRQMEQTLYNIGYTGGLDAWHWWEPGAMHNEAEWGARVFRPLGYFVGL